MIHIEELCARLQATLPGASVEIVPSAPAAQQPALLVDGDHLLEVARYLQSAPDLQLDYCSCVTGVDYLQQGYIEVVYHLYSVALKHGPIVLKARTPRAIEHCELPSLTPIWRGCEFQEREVYDTFGVRFRGHPDLRRILMWDEFVDHPLRKDYRPPSDHEWEPTPHGETLARARAQGGVIPVSARESKS